MWNRFSALVVLPILAGAIAGCDHQEQPIAKYQQIDQDNSFLATNAASRLVMVRPPPPTDGSPAKRIICSEPSPDIAMALSTVLALTGSGQAPNGVSGSVGYNQSTAEAITALAGRTEAVVALRDGLYKACEAYTNGLINRTSYGLILSQYGDLLVTLMLGEAAATAAQKSGSGSGTGNAASPGTAGTPGGSSATQPGITVAVGGAVTSANPSATAPKAPTPSPQQSSKLKTDQVALSNALTQLAKAQKPPANAADVSKAQAAVLAAAMNVALDLSSAASPGAEQGSAQTKTAADTLSTIYDTYYAKAPIRMLQSIVVTCLEDVKDKAQNDPKTGQGDVSDKADGSTNKGGPTKAAVCAALFTALSSNMGTYLTAAFPPASGTPPDGGAIKPPKGSTPPGN